MATLKAVLFDIDDTLFSTTTFAHRARTNAVRAMVAAGLKSDEETVLRELGEVVAEFSSNYDHHYDQLLKRLGPDAVLAGVNPALIVAAGVAAYHDTKFRELEVFDDVYPFLEDLRAAGLKTGVVTHGWTNKQAEKLVRLGLVPYLDPRAIFISDQIGISKPNPKIYQHALRELGLQPKEAMYIGDNPITDIAPPNELGMITVWIRRAAKENIEGTGIVPDHAVDDFEELRPILQERYGVEMGG
ncbi:MAG: TIGR02253 family HAD-type hydrolase [Planctomycetota bacterium]|nr:TIGR02253 family HAD-type hydrolase [Planctomycetota bacterium]